MQQLSFRPSTAAAVMGPTAYGGTSPRAVPQPHRMHGRMHLIKISTSGTSSLTSTGQAVLGTFPHKRRSSRDSTVPAPPVSSMGRESSRGNVR
eukprot:scaffold7335_cov417-Prasinococcus_capsulatus_cf.AAC.12